MEKQDVGFPPHTLPQGLGEELAVVLSCSLSFRALKAVWGSQRTLLMRESRELLLFFMIFI